ncbi:MAG: hypothetical protein ACRDDO_05880 [Plesiomonas shigelloides]
MSLKDFRHQFLLSVVRSRRKVWTGGELVKQTGLKEPVIAADLAELCASGAVRKAQTEQQQTYFFAEGVAC